MCAFVINAKVISDVEYGNREVMCVCEDVTVYELNYVNGCLLVLYTLSILN